jgi:RNA polymerase sigma-70 factor (ECF subfamily)
MEASNFYAPQRVRSDAPPPLATYFVAPSPLWSTECHDDDLVFAARNGDEAAFRVLVERYARLATRLASRFFRQRDVIEEITQISFMQAWCALGSYQPRGEKSFAAWLSSITINTCHDELRRAWRRKEEVFSALEEPELQRIQNRGQRADVERTAIASDLMNKLLMRLEPDDQLVLLLLKIEGWSVTEIAAHLNWSPAKVKMRVHRARHIFQRARRKFY